MQNNFSFRAHEKFAFFSKWNGYLYHFLELHLKRGLFSFLGESLGPEIRGVLRSCLIDKVFA